MVNINVPDHVENEQAYIAAAEARIAANALKGKRSRWLAEDATRAAVVAFVEGECNKGSAFFQNLHENFLKWGTWTPAQEAMIRRQMAKRDERKAEFAAIDAASQHIGTVGARIVFELVLEAVFYVETVYGTLHIHRLRSLDGNIVIYKGQPLKAANGDKIAIKATIKAHEEYKGAKQTIISRPILMGKA